MPEVCLFHQSMLPGMHQFPHVKMIVCCLIGVTRSSDRVPDVLHPHPHHQEDVQTWLHSGRALLCQLCNVESASSSVLYHCNALTLHYPEILWRIRTNEDASCTTYSSGWTGSERNPAVGLCNHPDVRSEVRCAHIHCAIGVIRVRWIASRKRRTLLTAPTGGDVLHQRRTCSLDDT